ncbi:MAG: hypothetical protein ACRDOH_03540 [Streptosporangiaceae bacterium]
MKQYLLSIYQPDGDPPPPEILEPIMRDVDAVGAELRAAGAWVFTGGLHPPDTAGWITTARNRAIDRSGVALTSTLGYSGFLLGPPAIGFLASEFGLRAGLTTLSFLALAAAVIAYLSRDAGSPSGGTTSEVNVA